MQLSFSPGWKDGRLRRKPRHPLSRHVTQTVIAVGRGLAISIRDPKTMSMLRTASAAGVFWFVWLGVVGCHHRMESQPNAAEATLLAVGAALPNLEGVDQRGATHQLSEGKGHPTVVYFYPKDATPGCTKEACAFRDVWQRYEQQGVLLYGVSRDDRTSHEHFAQEQRLPFPLIADVDGKWASTFGVPSRNGMSTRVSFLFDAQGRLAHVYPKVDPGVHANQVLADIATLQ